MSTPWGALSRAFKYLVASIFSFQSLFKHPRIPLKIKFHPPHPTFQGASLWWVNFYGLRQDKSCKSLLERKGFIARRYFFNRYFKFVWWLQPRFKTDVSSFILLKCSTVDVIKAFYLFYAGAINLNLERLNNLTLYTMKPNFVATSCIFRNSRLVCG